jgi:hypothetical protein
VIDNPIQFDSSQPEDALVEAHELIMTLWEEQLDEAGVARLEQLASERPEVRRLYVRLAYQRCMLPPLLGDKQAQSELTADPDLYDAMILPAIRESDVPADGEGAIELPALPASRGMPSRPVGSVYRRVRLVLAASILIAVALVGRTLYNRYAEHPAPATLVDSVEARWNGRVPAVGQPIAANVPLELTEGLVRLQFAGSDLIVQGPARFTPVAPNRIRLIQGAVWVRADSGPGFEVVTPGEIVKDLGTEFGVRVEPAGQTSVHVFEGRVEVAPAKAAAPSTVLKVGEAVVFDGNGTQLTKAKADPQAFVRPPEFYNAALAAMAAQLLSDPALVAHLTFTGVNGKAHVASETDVGGIGRQIKFGDGDEFNPERLPEPAPGRRPGRTAVQFEAYRGKVAELTGDASRPLSFADENASRPFTVAAWIRAPKEQAAQKGACIATYGLDGQEQYSLEAKDGVYRFFVRDARGKAHQVTSQAGPNETWQLVVATFDPADGATRLYVDGNLQGSIQGPRELLPSAGGFRFGGRPGSSPVTEYAFDGTIDELIVWSKSLSSSEVSALHRAGE